MDFGIRIAGSEFLTELDTMTRNFTRIQRFLVILGKYIFFLFLILALIIYLVVVFYMEIFVKFLI